MVSYHPSGIPNILDRGFGRVFWWSLHLSVSACFPCIGTLGLCCRWGELGGLLSIYRMTSLRVDFAGEQADSSRTNGMS